jgi:hypothetical protein
MIIVDSKENRVYEILLFLGIMKNLPATGTTPTTGNAPI